MSNEPPLPEKTLPRNPDKPFLPCEPTDQTLFDSARIRYCFTRTLPVSPQQLFDVFEDPESWPRWATGIGAVEWTSPRPFGVGTTRTVTFWGGMEVFEEFVAWERGREMAFVFYGTTQEVWTRFGEHYRVEDLGEEQCRLTWTVAYDPTGTFGRMHGLFGWIMRVNLGS
ncbi:MAG: SRPBCC family protein, partial [Myxococcota bacterium]|nr:SRPBCC family protein [Myxococcota bacterium]